MDSTIREKIEGFFTQFRHQTYKKGEVLIRADEDPTGILYLKDGIVKQYAISRKGDELVVNVFKPGVFFPMSWAINNIPNSYFFEATTDTTAWRAPREDVISFIKQNPDVLYDLMGRVYRGTDGLLTRMAYLMSGSAYTRLITELLIQGKRFGVKEGSIVRLHISEIDLAARSGMTRETISREIKTLKEKHLVTFEKNELTINNIETLEEELEGGI